MSKLKLLILDASEVIHLHEFGIWGRLIGLCEVHLARTVIDIEAQFFEKDGETHSIDLADDIATARVRVFEVSLADLSRFLGQFDAIYVGELDPGETEALAYLTQSADSFLISSGDAIVYRVLGRLNLGEQGISLEEILSRVGLSQKKLPWACQKKFREMYTRLGETDAIQGKGLKRTKE
jgi:hypothetical protein